MSKFHITRSNDSSFSPLAELALLFHQDFSLMDIAADEMATQFICQLTQKERTTLKREISDVLIQYPGKEQRGLRNAWRRLGADWWDKKQDLRDSLENWSEDA